MNNKSLEFIYEQLQDKYDLVLTNTFALECGYSIDVPVLCGTSVLGNFHLYFDDDFQDSRYYQFVFSVKFPHPKKRVWFMPKEEGTHWHPQSVDEAINDVIAFMEGNLTL